MKKSVHTSPIPILVATDTVLFGYTPQSALQVLLIARGLAPFKGDWALPGGFVRPTESLDESVRRELEEETGIIPDYLEQLYTFGETDRDPRGHIISIAYFGLVRPAKFILSAGTDAESAHWWPVNELPTLAFDHDKIITLALKRLKTKVLYEPIGFELLDEKFPFGHLEHLYTTLSGRPIGRRNFRKKLLQYDYIEALEEKHKQDGSGRPGILFKFNKSKYEAQKAKGVDFGIVID